MEQRKSVRPTLVTRIIAIKRMHGQPAFCYPPSMTNGPVNGAVLCVRDIRKSNIPETFRETINIWSSVIPVKNSTQIAILRPWLCKTARVFICRFYIVLPLLYDYEWKKTPMLHNKNEILKIGLVLTLSLLVGKGAGTDNLEFIWSIWRAFFRDRKFLHFLCT